MAVEEPVSRFGDMYGYEGSGVKQEFLFLKNTEMLL